MYKGKGREKEVIANWKTNKQTKQQKQKRQKKNNNNNSLQNKHLQKPQIILLQKQ